VQEVRKAHDQRQREKHRMEPIPRDFGIGLVWNVNDGLAAFASYWLACGCDESDSSLGLQGWMFV
jgi:hypothetical protein